MSRPCIHCDEYPTAHVCEHLTKSGTYQFYDPAPGRIKSELLRAKLQMLLNGMVGLLFTIETRDPPEDQKLPCYTENTEAAAELRELLEAADES